MPANILPLPLADGESTNPLASIECKLDAILAHQANPLPPVRYLTVAQIVTYCVLSGDSVRDAISGCHLIAIRPPGCSGRILLDRQQIDAWLASGRGKKPRTGRGRRRSG